MDKSINKKISEHGIVNSLKKMPGFIYREGIRKILPTIGYQTLNGIKVQPIKFGDRFLSPRWRSIDEFVKPNYESSLVKGLKEFVKEGYKVVIVGGGKGVTTSIASKLTGPTGRVICYEASKQSVNAIKNTIAYNAVPDNIEVINKCVGEPISVWGDLTDKVIQPNQLPQCELLELDCEGAEKKILNELSIRPEIILVETHGIFNSSTKEIVGLLQNIGYKIVNTEVAEVDLEQYCIENDIRVIWAQKTD